MSGKLKVWYCDEDVIIKSGSVKASEILAYLQANKLVCQICVSTDKRHKTPGSETKVGFITAIAGARIT